MTVSWQAFLNYPPVVQYHRDAPGKYLFLKTLHELAAGCQTYQAFQQFWDMIAANSHIDASDQQAIHLLNASPVHAWYDQWFPIVEQWRVSLFALQAQYWDVPAQTDIDWPVLIAEIATLIAAVAIQYQEAQALPLPAHARAREYVTWIVGSVERLHFIYQAMCAHEYIRIYEYPEPDSREM
jgi:hypothetical protein